MSMWSVVLFCVLAYGGYYTTFGQVDKVTKGTWSVLNVHKCDNHEDFQYDCDVKRKRINRTHDAFDASLECDSPVEKEYSIRADIDKLVDGGFKPYQKLTDDSFCGFVDKYAGSNMEDALAQAGVDPPECPIPAGKYAITDFFFNYEDLPEDGIVGEYQASIYLVKESEDLACIFMNVKFEEKEEDDE